MAESSRQYCAAALFFRNQMDQAEQRSDLQLMRRKDHPELSGYPKKLSDAKFRVNSFFASYVLVDECSVGLVRTADQKCW